jgi:hypothetical protein
MLAYIVDEEGSYSSSIVGGSYGSVSSLTSDIPDLCLDGFCANLNRSWCKIYANRRSGVKTELVLVESTEQIGFANAGVTNENDLVATEAGVWKDDEQSKERSAGSG